MPPKTDETKGATTRSAAAKKEETAVVEPSSAPSPLEEKMERVLARFDLLAALPAKVDDLCTRMGALELRSGRSSPSKTPPRTSTVTPSAPATVAEASAPVPAVAQPSSTTAQPRTQPAVDTMSSPVTTAQTATAPTMATASTASQGGRDAPRPNPWSHWAPDIQSEMRVRLSKRGLSLTQLFDESDDSAPVATAGRDLPSTPPVRQLVCKHEILGSFDGSPTKLELFLSRVRAIGRKRIPGWEDAVLAAVPDALTGHAAKWHASLTKQESDAIDSLDALCEAMRRAFPINRAQLRSLARQRRWEPNEESAMNYYYDKVLLLRQAFGDTYSEKALAQDVADGLDASMRGYVRLPTENPTLQQLQEAMAEWEPTWREVNAVSLPSSTGIESDTPGMVRSQSEPATPSTTVPLIAPLPPPPTRPPRSEQRQSVASGPASRQVSASIGSLSQTYDPSRVVPASNGQPRMYRLPNTTRVMRLNRNCNKCGQAHFDFEHEHLLTSGQIRVLEVLPYDELDESELDHAFVQSF